jgi:Ca-activated chloride channel family protein
MATPARDRLSTLVEPRSGPGVAGGADVASGVLVAGVDKTVQPQGEYANVEGLGYLGGTLSVQSARERDFKTVVAGVANVDPLTGLRMANVNYDSIEEVTDFAGAAGGFAAPPPPPPPGSLTQGEDPLESGGTESYAPVGDNPFHRTADEPLSTFSADVDTASYSNVRRFLESGQRPPADAVRIEELINYFDYEHPKPEGSDPFGVDVEVAECPWQPAHRLARITLAARREARADYPGSNLVFLLDVSGSMQPPNKLPLLQKALGLLVDQLDARDSVSIVVYAGAEGLVLPPTPGSDRATILEAIARLEAGGSTAGASGLRLAYEQARAGFIPGGVNRVVLATDGDFNVGVTSPSELLDVVAQDAERGIFLTVLGFGDGNLKDDRLEHLADHGNGNYAYIDGLDEARKVLVEEIGGTLVTVAKDVKFQVEFNPLQVAAYRLIGYSNRLLAHRDFNDDTKDAGEVGVGHTVTVLYEIEPAGPDAASADEARQARREVDPLRYRRPGGPSKAAESGELLTLKVRFKRPAESSSELRTYAVHDDGLTLGSASDDFRFAAAVAAFGMRLRGDAAVASFEWAQIRELAGSARTSDEHGHRAGFLRLVDSTQGAR